jgi:hypothetical protein
MLSTPPLTRATNAASESSGNPVCTGFTKSVPASALRAARASPPDTSVFPTAVFAPHTANAAHVSSTSRAARVASARRPASRSTRRSRARGNRRAAVVVVVVVVAPVVAPAHRRASARIASRRPPRIALDRADVAM